MEQSVRQVPQYLNRQQQHQEQVSHKCTLKEIGHENVTSRNGYVLALHLYLSHLVWSMLCVSIPFAYAHYSS